MFKIDNKGSCDITNLQCSLCCGNGGGVSGSGIYHGTGYFGPGFTNAGTLIPDTMSINNAISLLRQPNTYYPTQFGLGLGVDSIHESAIVIGNHSDESVPNNSLGTISIGNLSGQSNQDVFSIAIGDGAGQITQYGSSVAIGPGAGNNIQGTGFFTGGSVAIGVDAGNECQGAVSVAMGPVAGASLQGNAAVAIGFFAGLEYQGNASVAIGYQSGSTLQGEGSVAIGPNSGATNQGQSSIAIGVYAGSSDQGEDAISIGYNAANDSQGNSAIAIGSNSGQNSQGVNGIAIGNGAGFLNQGVDTISIGSGAGTSHQNQGAIAIGLLAGQIYQGTGAIAIGNGAGASLQGINAIAIGTNTAGSYQDDNSIIINATGNPITSTGASTCVITPIRNAMGSSSTHMFYNSTTGELTYGSEAPSSMRFKKDIIDMTEKYTDAIFRLRPVEFKYKSNDKVGIGFIAEEMESVIPEIVIKNAISDEIESIDYQYLVALVKIIQQQQDELNKIKSHLGI